MWRGEGLQQEEDGVRKNISCSSCPRMNHFWRIWIWCLYSAFWLLKMQFWAGSSAILFNMSLSSTHTDRSDQGAAGLEVLSAQRSRYGTTKSSQLDQDYVKEIWALEELRKVAPNWSGDLERHLRRNFWAKTWRKQRNWSGKRVGDGYLDRGTCHIHDSEAFYGSIRSKEDIT